MPASGGNPFKPDKAMELRRRREPYAIKCAKIILQRAGEAPVCNAAVEGGDENLYRVSNQLMTADELIARANRVLRARPELGP